MYDLYIMYLSLSIQNLEQKIEAQRLIVNNHLNQVSSIKVHIQSYIDFNALINGQVNTLPEEYKVAIGKNYNYYNIIVRNYNSLYNILLSYEKDYRGLKDQKISFNVYKTIITKYNKKVLSYCIDTGKAFSHKYFGTIQLFYRSKEGVAKKINWKKSNENKKRILEKGGEPYLEKNAITAKEKGIEYKGEKWIANGYDNGLLYWRWYPPELIKETIKREVYNYKYIPARGLFGAINMLSDVYKKDTHDYTIYST